MCLTLCVLSEKSPTIGQILLILKKLEHHYCIKARNKKEKIWTDLSAHYQVSRVTVYECVVHERQISRLAKCPQVFEHECFLLSEIKDEEIQTFLGEATVMDPRFKLKMDNTDAIWDRLRTSAVAEMLTGEDEAFESQSVVQFHCDAMYFILKVPVPEDTQSQMQYEDVEEEDNEEGGYVSTVHYNDDHMVYS